MKPVAGQCGQALIEFAIVLFVALVVIAGGIELGAASLNSYVLRQATDAGAQSWVGRYCARGGNYYLARSDGRCVSDVAMQLCALPGDADPYYLVSENPDCGNPVTGHVFDTSVVNDPATAGAVRPSCTPPVAGGECTEPDDGLPDFDPQNPTWYPYTHRAIDISGCVSATGSINYSNCVNRIFEGFGAYPGLPAANRALYSLYQLRCYDGSDGEVACITAAAGGSAVTWLLRLPGRFDPATDDLTLANVCFDDGCSVPVADTHQLDAITPTWPVFALEDAGAVRFRIRYRHQFYAIMGGGFYNDGSSVPLDAAVVAELDLGIQNRGGLGAEVTTAGDAPSYFRVPWKTFAACGEVSNAGLSGRERAIAC